jgi:hypothetical protein
LFLAHRRVDGLARIDIARIVAFCGKRHPRAVRRRGPRACRAR